MLKCPIPSKAKLSYCVAAKAGLFPPYGLPSTLAQPRLSNLTLYLLRG